jgi:hypothetical protein
MCITQIGNFLLTNSIQPSVLWYTPEKLYSNEGRPQVRFRSTGHGGCIHYTSIKTTIKEAASEVVILNFKRGIDFASLVARRAGTTIIFLLGSQPHRLLKNPAQVKLKFRYCINISILYFVTFCTVCCTYASEIVSIFLIYNRIVSSYLC